MDTQYWIGNLITSVVGALVGFLLGRRKYNKEVDNIAIQNMQKSLEFYQNLSDDNKTRLEAVLNENTTLREEIERVRTENAHLKNEMKELRSTVDKLTNMLASYGLGRLIEDADNNATASSRKVSTKKDNGKEDKASDAKKEV